MQKNEYHAIVSAPGFALGIVCDGDDWVTSIDFLDLQAEQTGTTLLARESARQLHAFLQDPVFVFGLPLKPSGTVFQRRVWQQVAAIPCGETRSYGELARTLHSAPRAVGQACGANPFPIVVPCHRVIAASGGLGGFNQHREGFPLDIKSWLLVHEQR